MEELDGPKQAILAFTDKLVIILGWLEEQVISD